MKKIKAISKQKKGFTLIELIVVLVILAILAALLIPSLTGYIDQARQKTLVANCRHAVTAAQTLYTEHYGQPGIEPAAADIKTLAQVEGNITGVEAQNGSLLHLSYDEGADSVTYCRHFDTCGVAGHTVMYNIAAGVAGGLDVGGITEEGELPPVAGPGELALTDSSGKTHILTPRVVYDENTDIYSFPTSGGTGDWGGSLNGTFVINMNDTFYIVSLSGEYVSGGDAKNETIFQNKLNQWCTSSPPKATVIDPSTTLLQPGDAAYNSGAPWSMRISEDGSLQVFVAYTGNWVTL